jgi:hypothetical protein
LKHAVDDGRFTRICFVRRKDKLVKLTKNLRVWAVAHTDVEADADDSAIKMAVATALVSGDLSPEELKTLSIDDDDKAANQFMSTLQELKAAVAELKTSTSAGLGDFDGLEDELEAETETEVPAKKSVDTKTKTAPTAFEKLVTTVTGGRGLGYDDDATEEKSMDIRVKEAADNYSSTKSALHFPNETKKGWFPSSGR